jgi:hypothetical protein
MNHLKNECKNLRKSIRDERAVLEGGPNRELAVDFIHHKSFNGRARRFFEWEWLSSLDDAQKLAKVSDDYRASTMSGFGASAVTSEKLNVMLY